MAGQWDPEWKYAPAPSARIVFHGFEASLSQLQSCGWRGAEERLINHYLNEHERRLLLSRGNEGFKLLAICREGEYERWLRNGLRHDPDARPPVYFVDRMPFSDFQRTVYRDMSVMPVWQEVDMSHTISPMYRDLAFDMLDWNSIFPPRKNPRDEIYIAGADMSVSEHLEAIKRLQAPMQKELREKARKAAQLETIAQLIKVA